MTLWDNGIATAIANAVVQASAAVPLSGGTMTGSMAMGSNKITSLANGSAASDAAAFGQIPIASTTTPIVDGTGAVGNGTTWARSNHVHPTDTSRAPLASPALTGTPTVPTASAGTNTTQAASTAFTTNAVTNSSNRATHTTLALTSGTATVLNSTSDVMFYAYVTTAMAFTATFGPSTGAEYPIASVSVTVLAGSLFGGVRIPAGWKVTVTTTTIANLNLYTVTC